MDVDNRLQAIGFGVGRQTSECWRLERAGPAGRCPAAGRHDPALSRALSVWLARLRDRSRPTAYRICQAAEGD